MESKTSIINHVELKHWFANSNVNLLSSKIELRRNVDSFNFPSKMESAESAQICQLLCNLIVKSEQFDSPRIIKWNSLTKAEKKRLKIMLWIDKSQLEGSRDPHIVINATGSSYVIINGQDHINISTICYEDNHLPYLSNLENISRYISSHIKFSFSNKFGFLTKNIKNCGTGFVISSFLSSPLMGMFGKTEDFSSDLIHVYKNYEESCDDHNEIVITNKKSYGMSREEILREVITTTGNIVAKENQYAKQLSDNHNENIIDIVCRSFGILKTAIRIKPKEMFHFLHILKAGVSMDIIVGTDQRSLNELIFNIKTISDEEFIDTAYIRDFVSSISLNVV